MLLNDNFMKSGGKSQRCRSAEWPCFARLFAFCLLFFNESGIYDLMAINILKCSRPESFDSDTPRAVAEGSASCSHMGLGGFDYESTL